jgi:hypothetical protein
MPGASPGVEPGLLPLPVRTLSRSGQVSRLPVNPVSTPECTETDPAMVGPVLVLNSDSSEGGSASTSSTQPGELLISSSCASASHRVASIEVADARNRSAEFEEEAATQQENRMTRKTMEDQALAAARAEEDEVHDARLDAHRTELERINLQAGD